MGDLIAVVLSFALALFCVAWVTALPTIGLLWCVGWL